jgi:hypothetical protein
MDELIRCATGAGLKTAWAEGVVKKHGQAVLRKAIQGVNSGLAPMFIEQVLDVDTLVLDLCVMIQGKKAPLLFSSQNGPLVAISNRLPPDPIGEAPRKAIADAIASCGQRK